MVKVLVEMVLHLLLQELQLQGLVEVVDVIQQEPQTILQVEMVEEVLLQTQEEMVLLELQIQVLVVEEVVKILLEMEVLEEVELLF